MKVKIDYQKLERILRLKNISLATLSRKLGRGDTYISNCKSRNYEMNQNLEKLICKILQVEQGTFILTEAKKEHSENIPQNQNNDLKPVLEKLEDIRMAIEKLGNIEMQNMEYIRQMAKGER